MLVLAAFALLCIGLVMVYSASSANLIDQGKSASEEVVGQLRFALMGVVFVVLLWKFIPHRVWTGPFLWGVWVVAIALILYTAIAGINAYGATRWLQLGPISMQPSEFVKIALLLMFARIMCDLREGVAEPRALLAQAFLLVLVPLLVMYWSQSDLGTTMICGVGILAVMWLGGVDRRWFVFILVLVAGFLLYSVFGTGYRSDRMVYLDPWNDGQDGYGAGYNIKRSYYAIAEGGLFGVGLGNSHEKFQYLFGSENDFIFAIVCEELGMLGALVVIGLFLVILIAGLRIAENAPDDLGVLIAGGFTIMLVFQAFLNIGSTIGVLPTTGKPLPFISAGGTSLLATMIMVGLILSVSNASGDSSVYERRRADLRIVRSADARSDRPARNERLREPGRAGRRPQRNGRLSSRDALDLGDARSRGAGVGSRSRARSNTDFRAISFAAASRSNSARSERMMASNAVRRASSRGTRG